MPIIDCASHVDVLGDIQVVQGSPYATPSDAYVAWAADIGVSSTGTVSSIDADDDAWLLDAGVPILSGGTETRFAFSSEGGIALYKDAPLDTTVVNRSLLADPGKQSIERFYAPKSPPSLVVSVKYPTIDARSDGCKWRKAGGVTIVYAKWRNLSSQTNIVTAAFRLEASKMEVVCRAESGTGAYLQLFCFWQNSGSSLYALKAEGAMSFALADMTTYHYATTDAGHLSGAVLDESGVGAARTVRAYRRDTGGLIGAASSDSQSGAFSIASFYGGEHVLFALDDDAGTQYNAIIYDRVTPV